MRRSIVTCVVHSPFKFSTELYDSFYESDNNNTTISIWGMPELIWEPVEYFFVGIGYEHRYKYCRTKINPIRYSEDIGEYLETTKIVPILRLFAGIEQDPTYFKWAKPYTLVQYDFREKIWQFTIGQIIHLKRSEKKCVCNHLSHVESFVQKPCSMFLQSESGKYSSARYYPDLSLI